MPDVPDTAIQERTAMESVAEPPPSLRADVERLFCGEFERQRDGDLDLPR